MDALKSYIREHFNAYVDDLKRAIRQPSVAASGEGISECAELMAALFRDAGAEVALIRAAGAAPLLLAEFPGRSERTLLFYNHYDVQPADPLNEWTTPAFEPAVRDGKIYGRGTADNKGNIVSRLSAVKALKAVRGGLPARVKFLIEGEEEIGSVHFTSYVEENKNALRSDACIWESGGRDLKERLDAVAGVKGICYLDLSLEATARDLHSSAGAIVEGAGTRMAWALASLKDPVTGRVQVQGFYDRVRKPTPEEEEVVRSLPFDEDERKRLYGVKSFIGGKTGYEAHYDLSFMPTCTVCGINTGYTGPGSKTVLPRRAGAKVDFRMVPDQDPEEIAELVRRHFTKHGFSDITVKLLGGERAYRSPLNNPFIQMAARIGGEATGREVVLSPTSAGTGPMYPVGTTLKVPIVSMGTSYWDSRGHAPNENIRLADFEETIDLMARVMEEFPRLWT